MKHRWVIWVGVGLISLLVIGYAAEAHSESRVQSWCRNQVHVGESFLDVPAAPKGHLVSVSGGVWTYDGGVTVTVLDDQVADKSCG